MDTWLTEIVPDVLSKAGRYTITPKYRVFSSGKLLYKRLGGKLQLPSSPAKDINFNRTKRSAPHG